jgi:PEP-CTERM motif-containing protein
MLAKRIVVAVVGLLFALVTSRAEAESITLSSGFVASGFEDGAPVDPVIGSFTITFDNSTNLRDQTTGVTYHNLNLVLDSAPSFDYGRFADVLILGAAVGGTAEVGTGTNDFFFNIYDASTHPFAGPGFTYSQASGFHTFTGNVTLTPFATPTPEPGTLLLFGSGAAVALSRRRRFAGR